MVRTTETIKALYDNAHWRIPFISGRALARAAGLLTQKAADGSVNGRDFEDYGIPMVIECYDCKMSLTFFSCFAERKSGVMLCHSCKDMANAAVRKENKKGE